MQDDLLKRAAIIRDEIKESKNTAHRVGSLFIDIIQQNIDVEDALHDFDKEIDSYRWIRIIRGEWSEEIAKSKDPYRIYSELRKDPDGVHEYHQTFQHVVYRYALRWGCIKDKTLEPPHWDCRDWILLDDYPKFLLKLTSTNGYSFRPQNMDTHIEANVLDGTNNITKMLKNTPGSGIEWFRNTDNELEDRAWKPTVDAKDDLYRIHITKNDMGANWMLTYRDVTFICRVTIPAGAGFRKIEAKIIVK